MASTTPLSLPPGKRHILLCVAGLTPQIITETLYALTQQQGVRVDEIRVITTLSGRDRIVRTLLDPRQGRFFAFCHDYGIDPAGTSFTEETITLLHTPDGRMLGDIRSVQDNGHAANQICEIVRELTRDPHTCLYASAAGGRKTMSIYLTAAMQLFGRAQDRLSHVLVSEPFETHREFYYIPPEPRTLEVQDRQGHVCTLSTEQATIQLADIPFIRLRGLIPEWLQQRDSDYNDMVRRAQEDLDLIEGAHSFRIHCRSKTLTVANRRLRLTVLEFFLHALLASLRQQGRGQAGFVRLDEITTNDLADVFCRIRAAHGLTVEISDHDLVPGFGFLGQLRDQLASTHRRDREHLTERFSQLISKSRKRARAAGIPRHYLMTAHGRGAARRYGLQVEPDRIVWEDAPVLPTQDGPPSLPGKHKGSPGSKGRWLNAHDGDIVGSVSGKNDRTRCFFPYLSRT